MKVLLHGGPAHGQIAEARNKHGWVELVPPLRVDRLWLDICGPRPPVWRWRAWRAWRAPQCLEVPPLQVLRYRYLATADDGTVLFAPDPWALAPGELGMPLAEWLYRHHGALSPEQKASALRWVMDKDWAAEVAKLAFPGDPRRPTEEDIRNVNGGQLLGLPVAVTATGGAPHLVPVPQMAPPAPRVWAGDEGWGSPL